MLITGATDGMGHRLAELAAEAGATVLLHGRDAAKLGKTEGRVRAKASGGGVRTYRADLSDLEEVRALGEELNAREPHLDVLVNNAVVGGGADTSRREVSAQGHELRFAVNTLAPALLTRLLEPLLSAAAAARVVNVASMGQAPFDLDDLMFERGYEGVEAYCRSKLALIAHTFSAAARLRERGTTVNAIHPAHLMDTSIVRESGFAPAVGVDHGAEPTLRLVADPALEAVTGRYFDRFDDAEAHSQAYDTEARERLEERLADLLGGHGF